MVATKTMTTSQSHGGALYYVVEVPQDKYYLSRHNRSQLNYSFFFFFKIILKSNGFFFFIIIPVLNQDGIIHLDLVETYLEKLMKLLI